MQIELVSAMMKCLDEHGRNQINTRQINAVIEAANIVVTALDIPYREAKAGAGLEAWLASDETGMSSMTMAKHLAPLAGINRSIHTREVNYPHDPGDLNRCLKLLAAVPELRPHIKAMKAVHPVWAGLVARWDELESTLAEESKRGDRAPKTYDLMRSIIEECEVKS